MSREKHVLDYRMKKNQSLIKSQKKSYTTRKSFLLQKEHIKLIFKKISKEQEEKSIKRIRKNYRNFAKRELLIFSTILIILTIIVLYFLNIVNFQ